MLKMITPDLYRVFMLAIPIWTTSLIASPKTNAQWTNSRDDLTSDSTNFFFQQSEYPRDCKEILDQCSSDNFSGVYSIKPDGYPEPFETYCDDTNGSFGWTVIYRRNIDGIIDFDRDWYSYKNGFGFLSHEFWVGNEKRSYLTNQNNYQLMIEMTLLNGSKVTVSYNNFRIGDELSRYRLFSLNQYSGVTDVLSWCPSNMLYDNCTCGQRLCLDPNVCQNTCADGRSEGCNCPEGFYIKDGACVPEQECGCYILEKESVLSEGDTHVNTNCTMLATCSNGQLAWNRTYECSPNAVCGTSDGERKCHCNEGFLGDGEICDSSTDCMDIYNAGFTDSGVYSIKPRDWPGSQFEVYCNMTDGGGWTVFQRRIDGDVDFYLGWSSYKEGFGDVDDEHWLGNEQLYYLTNQGNYQIRIDFVNRYGAPYYAKFTSFRITNEGDNYRLSEVGTYSGTADSRSSPDGYALSYHRGYQFSTKDRDNDVWSSHCAQLRHGAWWYKACTASNLNGDYHFSTDGDRTVHWDYLPGNYYKIKYTEMKIRPI